MTPKEFYDLELKIREVHDKVSIEKLKASVEFAKIVVTYLFIINAGALLALPTVAKTINADAAQIAPATAASAVFYVVGLMAAFSTALFAYLNFQNGMLSDEGERNLAINATKRNNPGYCEPDKTAEVQKYNDLVAEGSGLARRRMNWQFQAAHWSGWASILGFGIGSINLINNGELFSAVESFVKSIWRLLP